LELPYDYLLEKHSHMLEGQNENQTTLRLLYYPPLYPEDSRFDLIKSNQMYSYQRCAMDRLIVGYLRKAKMTRRCPTSM